MCTLTLVENIHSGFKLSRICPRFAVLRAILFVCGQQQKQGSSGGIQSGPTIKSCDFFLNPMQQMQQILILSHPILLLFTFI